jgi:hypothetical protein
MLFFKSHAASPAHLLCGKGRRAQFPKRWVLGHPKPTKPKRLNANLLQTKKKKLNFQINESLSPLQIMFKKLLNSFNIESFVLILVLFCPNKFVEMNMKIIMFTDFITCVLTFCGLADVAES